MYYVIYKRVFLFSNNQKLLSEKEYRFRKNENKQLATLDFVKKILPAIENKSFFAGIFIDYRACFVKICR